MQVHDFRQRHGMVRTKGKRIGFRIPVLYFCRKLRRWSRKGERAPDAPQGKIRVEILHSLHGTYPVKAALFVIGSPASLLQHSGHTGIEHLVRIARSDGTDAELVRSYKKLPVGHALGNPKSALTRWRRLHLQNPSFVPVRHQKCLACPPKAVLINQAAHQPDCFPGRAAAFQGHAPQFRGIKNTMTLLWFQIFQMSRIVRTFAEHQTVFVHHAVIAVDIGIGMGSFRYFSQRLRPFFSRIVVVSRTLRRNESRIREAGILRQVVPGNGGGVHFPHRAGRMIFCRHKNDTGIAGIGIIGMRHVRTAVCRSPFCHNRRSAGFRAGGSKADNTQRNGYNGYKDRPGFQTENSFHLNNNIFI